MDNSHITSPLPSHVYDFNPHGPQGPTRRSPTHASRPFGTPSGPMSIPNVRIAPPPPLPPPRNPVIAAGNDLALQWANTLHTPGKGGTGSVPQSSSLHGGYRVKQEDRDFEGPGSGPGSFRRGSSLTIKSDMLPDTEMKYDMFRNRDEGYHSLSGPSLTSHMSVSLDSLPNLLACIRMARDSPRAAICHACPVLPLPRLVTSVVAVWGLVSIGCLK